MLVLLLVLLLLVPLAALLCARGGRKRRKDEPPLIKGWIPFLGKALEFGKNAYTFLEEHKRKFGDVFTVLIAGKYMTFIMDPLLYPNVIKQGRQLDFSEFSNKVAPVTFGYPPVVSHRFPGLKEEISRSFKLLQGDNLSLLTESMMSNLMLLFHQDHMGQGGWRSGSMYDFCFSTMFEATFLTMYGRPPSARRHRGMSALKEDFLKFDTKFPLLIAQVPIWLLGQTKAIRKRLIDFFHPSHMCHWLAPSQFIQRRAELFDQHETLRDEDKGAHHFAILWASVGNTAPASFWALYHLVRHPEALRAVRQEILDVLGLHGLDLGRETDLKLSRAELDRLVFLESAIKESLRLSSASMNIRVAQEDFHLRLDTTRSMAVRRGDIIALYPQTMHFDPQIYEEPQTFQFDRYVQDHAEKTDFYKGGQKLKYYLMPFGSGSSKCPGRHFAINEMKQFLCLLLLYFEMQLEEEQGPVGLDFSRAGLGILLPATDVRFRYRLRGVGTGHRSAI